MQHLDDVIIGVDVGQEPHIVLSQPALVNWEVALVHVVNSGVDLTSAKNPTLF